MAGQNLLFVMRHAPFLARTLRELPRSSRDRRAIEEQIEAMSQAALTSADQLFKALSLGLYHPDHGEEVQAKDPEPAGQQAHAGPHAVGQHRGAAARKRLS